MDPRVAEEYARFYKFINEIIIPNQPTAFVARSEFHNDLVLRAVKKMSATAAPRGFLKSTTLARYRALHRITDPTSRPEMLGTPPDLMLLSETTRLSKEHLEWIKNELVTNQLLIKKYGYLADPATLTWNEDEIRLKNGARALALGYGSQVRGRHPTDIIVDDLEGLGNMGTEESLEKLKDWFYRVLMGSMTPETHLTVIGTIIARQSLLSELVTHDEFDGRVYRALESETLTHGAASNKSLWAERYPVKLLLRLRKRFGIHRFNAEYQNEPLGLKDQIIFSEWVRHHTHSDLSTIKPVRRFMAVDPAFTEERWGDYSAIVVLDEVSNGMLYERLAWRKKVALPELRDTIMSFYRHFSMDCQVQLGIEEVAAQKAVRQAIQELDSNINIIPMRPDKDKARRLIDVSRYFEMGLVSLMTPSFEDELLNFPMGDKDRIDALVYTLKMYEMAHPIKSNNAYSELDVTSLLKAEEQQLYVERALAGEPGYALPSQLRMSYNEAMMLNEFVDEFM